MTVTKSTFEEKFQEKYTKLNQKQKEAVEQIDGPVLVVAGPGSGKTELLSIRTCNILRKTDILPNNILLLTFTESAAYNMRERLTSLIGEQAYRIGIYTFHSFASDILGKYPEFFWNGARFSPGTEVDQINIIQEIVKNLPRKNPLSSHHPELGYVYIKDIISSIKDLKKGGLTPEEFAKELEKNISYYKDFKNSFESLREIKGKRKYEEVKGVYLQIFNNLEKINDKNLLKKEILESLGEAIKKAEDDQKTTTLTTWKNLLLEEDESGGFALKDANIDRINKLKSLVEVYTEYQKELERRAIFDFEDMIILVRDALKNNHALRSDLQEKFQYILIDEFQDTNDAQFQLVYNLLDFEGNFGRPNIFAVGDDDQAIFKFQGAQLSNIINFRECFTDTKLIILDSNYRSTQKVLDLARNIILKAENRLETKYIDVKKEITSQNKKYKDSDLGEIIIKSFDSQTYEFSFITEKILDLLKQGVEPKEIAIICRKHEQLKNLSNVLNNFQIPYSYEKRENVLEKPHIHEIIQILKFLNLSLISGGEEYLPEILSFPFWEIEKIEIWKIAEIVKNGEVIGDSIVGEKKWKKISWLEAMNNSENQKVKEISNFLINLSIKSQSTPMEYLIDEIIGTTEFLWEDSEHDDNPTPVRDGGEFPRPGRGNGYVSPYKKYYFNNENFKHNKPVYLDFLLSLRTLIGALREFHQGKVIYAKDIEEFLNVYNGSNLTLSVTSPFASSENSISLLTAHKSKGLEFEYVFMPGLDQDIWKKGGFSSKIKFPFNFKLGPESDNDDDKIRLLFVALTRAKHTLYITHSENILEYLADEKDEKKTKPDKISKGIYSSLHIVKSREFLQDEKILLKRLLENYKMPVTHLNNFLNFTKVGPEKFIEQNLLRFPQAISPSSAYGSAMHATVESFFLYYNKHQKFLDQKIVNEIFENNLSRARLTNSDHKKYLEDGIENLEIYFEDLKKRKILPNTKVEVKFGNEGVLVGGVPVTGNIDKMEFIDDKEIIVTDLKTGESFDSLDEDNVSNSYEKIKLHFFKYQLAYYALLIENSRTYSKYKIKVGNIEFLENKNGKISIVPFVIDEEIKNRVKNLTNIVYKKIQDLDFPDTSNYPQTLKGVVEFENKLLEELGV